MRDELNDVGGSGFVIVGVTVGETASGGEEVVAIVRRVVQ